MRGLTAEQKALREGKLTASMVGRIMSGNLTEMTELWEIMVGLREEEDLSGKWPVQLGLATEEVNLDWYARKTGHEVTRRGSFVAVDWMGCTLDGWDSVLDRPVEAKHVGGHESEETVLARYQPQLHWTMLCTQRREIALSVISGAAEPVVDIVPFDVAYADQLMARAKHFMRYVDSLTPPVVQPPIKAPPLPVKIVDMMTTKDANQWGSHAAVWLENIDASKKADTAERDLKGLVPIDAKEATGSGVIIKRDRAGRLSLRREKTT